MGGDGTVHEIVNGILLPTGPAPALAILPAGTGNDFARNCGLPLYPAPALERAGSGAERRVDAGLARFTDPASGTRERAFVNSMSMGVSARANRLAHRIRKVLPGRFCYVLGGAAALLSVPVRRWRVSAGEELLLDGAALNLTVANGASFGGGLRISPGSRVDDGTLELVTIGDLGLPRAARAFGRLLAGTHLGLPGVSRRPVTTVRIEGDGPVELEADGHVFNAAEGVEVSVLPGALRLLS